MKGVQIIGLFAVILSCISQCKSIIKPYTVDVLEMDWNITTTDFIAMNFKVVQPSRGIFAFSGYFDLKEDMAIEKSLMQLKVYYSSNDMHYQLTPFHHHEQTVLDYLNGPYTLYTMDTLKECCENAPYADKFVTPLKKFTMKCEKCEFPTQNFPPAMRLGFYRVVLMFYNEAEFTISILVKLEEKCYNHEIVYINQRH
ncbi:uncharacterized protein LOC142233422 [Haematobia irritans]|uniref:uncharacterized protein LOC142233422 n=1 Tax=Haematobia irritans TaxID=7368 RepID=UPI003F4F7ABA